MAQYVTLPFYIEKGTFCKYQLSQIYLYLMFFLSIHCRNAETRSFILVFKSAGELSNMRMGSQKVE